MNSWYYIQYILHSSYLLYITYIVHYTPGCCCIYHCLGSRWIHVCTDIVTRAQRHFCIICKCLQSFNRTSGRPILALPPVQWHYTLITLIQYHLFEEKHRWTAALEMIALPLIANSRGMGTWSWVVYFCRQRHMKYELKWTLLYQTWLSGWNSCCSILCCVHTTLDSSLCSLLMYVTLYEYIREAVIAL